MVVVERYPDLKATQNFRDLQAQLEGTENRIAVERDALQRERRRPTTRGACSFPTRVYASILGFGEKAYFRAQAGAERAPEVNFDSLRRSPSPAH